MTRSQNSTERWLKLWSKIVRESREITELGLSEKSGASIWTIKALRSALTEYDAFIEYKKGKFRIIELPKRTLSTLFSDSDLEEMK